MDGARGLAVQWGAMAFEGDVATFPVGDLLAWLAQRRATGVISLTRGLTARRFHLRAGQVRLVSSSEQEMLLGQLLVERAMLGPEALAQTLATRGRSRARLGRLLARGGLVTPAQLQAILAEKTRRLLADAITWQRRAASSTRRPRSSRRRPSGGAPQRGPARGRGRRSISAAALEQIQREARSVAIDDVDVDRRRDIARARGEASHGARAPRPTTPPGDDGRRQRLDRRRRF